VNWLVKPHPNDEINKVITSTISEVKKICSNHDHVKIFPDDIAVGSIPKIIDVAVTQCGSASSEYPCFGIPTIIAGETICSGFGFTIEPQSKEEYFFQLKNMKKLEKLNNNQIELAKIFLFITYKLLAIPVNLIPPIVSSAIDEKKIWSLMTKLLKEYNFEENLLIKMMKIQETNNDMHTINYGVLEKRN
jgi:hypothetical protein